jgi:iron complex outermembrane receptor protein
MFKKWIGMVASLSRAALQKLIFDYFKPFVLLSVSIIFLALVIFIVSPSHILLAQDAFEPKNKDMPENETKDTLLSDNNTSQIVITADQIASMKVNKIEDVLNQAPGVNASSASVLIHGSSKVRVFLDGTPLNDPTSSYGAINLDHISLNSVDRVVIIKDAGGLHYGQDATGGVILIHTKNFSENKNTGQIRLWAGNHETYHGDADLMFTRGLWGLGLKGGYDKSHGYKINNDSERTRGGIRISRSFGVNKQMSLAADILIEETGFSGLPAFPTPYSRQRSQNITAMQATQWGNFLNNLYFNQGNVKNKDRSKDLDQELTVAEYGDSITYTRPFGPGDLSLGTGYRGISADSSEFGHHNESVIHLFLAQSATLSFLPITFKAGARYNINSNFENSLNPEFSVTYRGEKMEILYKISYGVNLPTFQQRYNRSSSTDPNPALGLEKATNQSLTVNYFPLDFLSFNSTLFHNKLRGRISYVRPIDSGIGQYRNLGNTLYQGFDIGFALKILKFLELKANYTYLEALDKDIDKFLTSQARDTITAEVSFRPIDSFSLTVKADYESKSYVDRYNTTFNPGRTLFSLRAEKSFGSFVIFLDGTNILDKEYYYVDGLLAPSRTYFLGAKYNF